MADTVETAIYRMGLDSGEYRREAASVTQSNQALVQSTEQVSVAEERVTRATRTTADGFARLEARIDPVVRAEMRLAQSLQMANRHLEEGTVSQERYGALVTRATAVTEQEIQRIQRKNNALIGAGAGYRSVGQAVQQAGFQVGDFAVQLASGQNAVVAFTQQGAQLLGMFGPWGAALGALGAILGAVWISMSKANEETEKAAKAAEEAAAAVYNHQKALETAKKTMEEINGLSETRTDRLRRERDENIAGAKAQIAATQALLANQRARLEEEQRVLREAGVTAPRRNREAAFERGLADDPETVARTTRLTEALEQQAKQLAELEAAYSGSEEALKSYEAANGDAAREAKRLADETAREAKQRAEADARRNLSLEQYITGLENAGRTEALSTEQKEIQRALIEAQNKLLDDQGKHLRELTDEERRRIETAVEQKRVAEDRARAEKKALDDHAREVKRAEDERVREANRATDRIEDYAADTLYAGLKGQNADLWEDFKDIALRTIAQVAAAMVFRPIIAPIVGSAMGIGGVGGGAGGLGGLSLAGVASGLQGVGALGGAANFGGMGMALSGIGAAAGLVSNAMSGASLLTGGSAFTGNMFASVGDFLGGAEMAAMFGDAGLAFSSPAGILGGMAGNMLANALFGGDRGMGADIGGMLGGIAGSFIPIPFVGTAAGAFLGNLVGGLFGGGGRKSTDIPGGQAELIRSGDMFIGGRPFSGHGGATAGVMSVSEMAATVLNTIQDSLDLNLAGGSRWNIEAGNEFASIFTGGGAGSRARFFGLNSTMVHAEGDALVKAVVDGVLRHGAKLDMFDMPTALKEGLSGAKNFDETIAALDAFIARRDQLTAMFDDAADAVFDLGSEIEKAAEAFGNETLAQVRSLREEAVKYGLTAAEVAAGLKVAVQRLVEVEAAGEPTMTQFEAQLELVRARFEALKPVLEEVGLAAALADQGLAAAEAKIREEFDQSISDAIIGLTDPLTLALEQLERQQAERLTNAEAIGADMVAVERLNALERQKVIEQQADAAVGAFRTVLDRLKFGDLGGAAPAAQLSGTRASFEAAVAQASAGDLMARGRLPELAEQLIEMSRGFYASGAGFQSDVQRAIAVLEQFQDLPGFAAGTASAPAGWAWVGERGPELVRFRGGEQVLPSGTAPANDGTSREMLRELIALRQEVSALRAEQARRADDDRDLRGQMRRIAAKVA